MRNRFPFSTSRAGFGLALGLSMLASAAGAADRALLIGIDRYKIPSLNLVGSENDVTDMGALLRERFGYAAENIRTLMHERATRQGILSEIENWLVKGTQPGDRVTLFYTGHGYRVADANRDDDDGLDETLVPYDVTIESGQVGNLILDDEIGALLKLMTDRKVTVIVDSCFSGTLTRGEITGRSVPKGPNGVNIVKSLAVVIGQANLPPQDRMAASDDRRVNPQARTRGFGRDEPVPQRAEGLPLLPRDQQAAAVVPRDVNERSGGFVERTDNVTAWSAVSASQLALVDTDERPGGVFTRRFVRGLRDRAADSNQDGQVNHQELLDYVRAQSEIFCNAHKEDCRDGLSPLLEATVGTGSTDVITAARPATVREQTNDSLRIEARPVQDAERPVAETPIKITILPDADFKVGELMRFSLSSSVDGYVIVLDIDAADNVTQLFPNRFAESVGDTFRMTAGRTITIPGSRSDYNFPASEPLGEGSLYAIISKDRLRIDDIAWTPQVGGLRGFAPTADARTFIEKLSYRLREIAERAPGCTAENDTPDCRDRAKQWWAVAAPYRISR